MRTLGWKLAAACLLTRRGGARLESCCLGLDSTIACSARELMCLAHVSMYFFKYANWLEDWIRAECEPSRRTSYLV